MSSLRSSMAFARASSLRPSGHLQRRKSVMTSLALGMPFQRVTFGSVSNDEWYHAVRGATTHRRLCPMTAASVATPVRLANSAMASIFSTESLNSSSVRTHASWFPKVKNTAPYFSVKHRNTCSSRSNRSETSPATTIASLFRSGKLSIQRMFAASSTWISDTATSLSISLYCVVIDRNHSGWRRRID